jgi:TolB-like protein
VATEDVPVPPDEVRTELERILASKGFQSAGRLSRLLRYVTEKTLAGESEQLKEYAVGVEVFDRDPSYDPRVDSIVRVEAGRLRARLDEYYANDGAANPLRITLPKGGYVAHFGTLRPRAPVAPPKAIRSSARLMVLASSIVIIAVMALWLSAWRVRADRPSIAVLSFKEYSADAGVTRLAAQLNDDVTSEMARLGTVAVVSHTSAMQFAGTRTPLREIGAALNADFLMEATVEPEPGGIRVVARLVNGAADRKVWVQDFHGKTDALRDVSRQIAVETAAAVLEAHSAR